MLAFQVGMQQQSAFAQGGEVFAAGNAGYIFPGK
jgi:hypothetical protein